MLRHFGVRIGGAVILPGDEPFMRGAVSCAVPLYRDRSDIFKFCPNEPLRETLESLTVNPLQAPTADVNAEEFIHFIKDTPHLTYLFSGPAGCILRPPLLRTSGKRFIHAHGGDAPRYSGSTAFYYSILEGGDIGATVFWMDEGLDTGDVIYKIVAAPWQGMDIDRIQDPVIRAEAMVRAIAQDRKSPSQKQGHGNRVTYHVIHPVLKHYALVKAGVGTRS
ncbi:MAG: hypothetical protein HYS17_00535 [Micavibrio aeruginosavorus]|uniref:Formyl transferase N-terminal domain-containing protein n=1 Tax=Micavibrio aeruginosavorus TaxID=349221 RepID=A0A7T5R2G1_9BACT|nr:MAG: hypothetical protein HYS17_00535 [Micavibrio aeruginosavorus]